MWQFPENRPRDVEKSVDGKTKITRPKYNSLPLSRATVKIFQDRPCRVAKVYENQPRDVEKSVVGKRIK